METSKKPLQSTVILTAFGSEGKLIEQTSISYDEFYSDIHTLIDDTSHISKEGIIAIAGGIYDSTGKMQSSFVNFYNHDGEYVRSRAIHADGSIFQD